MDSSVWKAALTIGRWIVGLVGLFEAVGAVREILTRPDRDVLVEMLGSVVSLHSVYFGGAAVGGVLALVLVFPVVRWLWRIPGRRKARKQEKRADEKEKRRAKERQMNEQVVGDLENLQRRIDAELNVGRRINHIENRGTIRILTNELKAMGFNLPLGDDERLYSRLYNSVSGLLPSVRLYGVKRVLSRLGGIMTGSYPPAIAQARFDALLNAMVVRGSPPDRRRSRRDASGGCSDTQTPSRTSADVSARRERGYRESTASAAPKSPQGR